MKIHKLGDCVNNCVNFFRKIAKLATCDSGDHLFTQPVTLSELIDFIGYKEKKLGEPAKRPIPLLVGPVGRFQNFSDPADCLDSPN